MNYQKTTFTFLIIALLCTPAFSQSRSEKPAEPVVMEAHSFDYFKDYIIAKDKVKFNMGNKKLTSDLVQYDIKTGAGNMKNVDITTCTLTRPHYHIHAQSVRLYPNGRMRARKISLYVGENKIITIPVAATNINSNTNNKIILPRPGYDKIEGYSLSQAVPLADSDRLLLLADVRLTSKKGINWDFEGDYGLDGTLDVYKTRRLDYESMRDTALNVHEYTGDTEYQRNPGASALRLFVKSTSKERAITVNDTGFTINRRPEVGITYTADPINLTNKQQSSHLAISPTITASWGKFDEASNKKILANRKNLEAACAINVFNISNSASLQPFVLQRWSEYDTGQSFKDFSYGIDYTRIIKKNGLISLRYIRRNPDGETPFEFDDVDVTKELQSAFQFKFNQHIFGFVNSYDLDKGESREWEILYGYSTDCLFNGVVWNGPLKRLSYNFSLLGF